MKLFSLHQMPKQLSPEERRSQKLPGDQGTYEVPPLETPSDHTGGTKGGSKGGWKGNEGREGGREGGNKGKEGGREGGREGGMEGLRVMEGTHRRPDCANYTLYIPVHVLLHRVITPRACICTCLMKISSVIQDVVRGLEVKALLYLRVGAGYQVAQAQATQETVQ